LNLFWVIFKYSVRTSQEIHCIHATKSSMLILFNVTVSVFCRNLTKNTNIFCGRHSESYNIQVDGTYSYHCAQRVNCINLFNLLCRNCTLSFRFIIGKRSFDLRFGLN
jgi:hypothetical protein